MGLKDIEVTEAFLLFFSNHEFVPKEDKLNRKYQNFLEYYMININKEYDIQFTEIVP